MPTTTPRTRALHALLAALAVGGGFTACSSGTMPGDGAQADSTVDAFDGGATDVLDHGADAAIDAMDASRDARTGADASDTPTDMNLADAPMTDAEPIHPTTDVTATIDTTQSRFAIHDNYVGIAFTRENISGQNGLNAIFGNATVTSQLSNLFHQIGIKHIRIVSHDASVADPTDAQNDAFFQFAADAGVDPHSIIYSFNNENVPTGYHADADSAVYLWTHYRSQIESFAIGNEPDWSLNTVARYDAYRTEWESIHSTIESRLSGLPGAPAPFSGPDTGSEFPARDNSTAIASVPFTLRFAIDERSRIDYATQHYYGGDTTEAPTWSAGGYYADDVVIDPSNHLSYRCDRDDPHSVLAPHNSTYWTAYPNVWSSSVAYSAGAVVQDPADATQYQCNSGCPASATHPSNAPARWTKTKISLLSAFQLANGMLDPSWTSNYRRLLDGGLTGATSPQWPSGLRFRMTEGNAYSGGHDSNNHLFALALWGVDFFHWWAAHGALGVDPFTIMSFYNACLYGQPGTGDIVAEPYAYGMLAFGQGAQGTTIDPSAVSLSTSPAWLTIYPVIGTGHLYVTLVNKTFNRIGSQDASVTLNASGFNAMHARLLRLESAPGATGDATVQSATLGGAAIVTGGSWAGTWESVPVRADGSVGPIVVRATSAVVVDITNR